jgi:saccharopine dehydrogenase-like NADP-dependent oxidoreductase
MLTAELLIAACIQKGVHYLNIAAKLNSYKLAEKNDHEAREANIILLLGCRGSIVILGYLASKVIEEVKNPASINISLYISGPMSRRLAISTSKNMSAESLQHINRELVKRETTDIIQLNFDNG